MEVEEESFPTKKKIHVNAASLVDLKAALYRKQQEVKQNRQPQTKKVSDKTAAIWRREPKKLQKGSQSNKSSKASGVDRESSSQLTAQEEKELAKSRAALEAKAKLYDQLTQGGRKFNSDEEESEDGPRYMVDFQRKQHESRKLKISQDAETLLPPAASKEDKDLEEEKAVNADEEWVEYIDSLGRTRCCMRKDLDEMKRRDYEMEKSRNAPQQSRSPTPELLSEDMRRERERADWEREAYQEATEEQQEEDTKPLGPIHYQNIENKEVRNYGVGYYSFSTEEEKRQAELQALNTLRDHTIDQRAKREKLKEKRQAILEAKLARVRQRKLKQGGGGQDSSSSINIADIDFESNKTEQNESDSSMSKSFQESIADQVAKAREKAEEEERLKHVRPWDRGKVMDPIRKRKQELREERPSEFAPPSFYKKTKETNSDVNWNQSQLPSTDSGSGNIEQTGTQFNTQQPPLFPYPPPPPGLMYFPYPLPLIYPPPAPPPAPPSAPPP